MNPFDKFEIDHLSARSLNLYADEPAFWCLCYLFKFRDEAGAAAWRGQGVEAGVTHWLYKKQPSVALQMALKRFEMDAMGDLDDSVEKERALVGPMLNQAISALQGRPEPTATQLEIKHWFDGIEVPVIGYIDYEFGDEGIDLKTTRRMPSVMRPSHARQLSLYQVARGRPYSALYVTDKKFDLKKVDDAATHVKRLEWTAHAIRRLLSVFPDKHDASRIFSPQFDSFYWNKESMTAAEEIWNGKC